MDIQLVTDAPLKYFVIDDFIPESIADAMIDEVVSLKAMMKPGRMRIQQKGKFVKEYEDDHKKNFDCFIDSVYRDQRSRSVILSNLNKLFFREELVKAYRDSGDMLFSYLLVRSNFDQTHLSAYGNGHYYRKHIDLPPCFLTANVMLCTDPKQFSGGDFEIHWSEDNVTKLEFKPRRMVLFPSAVQHCVSDIQMPEDLDFRHWRFSMQYWPQYRER
jgi:Rps23 Pro-64 3,4-dihydroxylase Tpa1-like proline 4-hydroxylase